MKLKFLVLLLSMSPFYMLAQKKGLSFFDINKLSSSSPSNLVVANDKVFFFAYENATGGEIYVYDGIGTPKLLHDLNPGTGSSTTVIDNTLKTVGDTLFFLTNPIFDKAIYKIMPGNPIAVKASECTHPLSFIPAKIVMGAFKNTIAYTTMTNDSMMALVKINPQSIIPDTLLQLPPHTLVREIIPCNDRIYITTFYGYHPNPTHFDLLCLYPTTNTIDTICTQNLQQGFTGNKIVYGNDLYFFFEDVQFGHELYKHDGITSPIRLTDLNPGPTHGASLNTINKISIYDNKVYFSGCVGIDVHQIAEYDILSKTTHFAPSSKYPHLFPKDIVSFNGKFYFTGGSSQTGSEVFVYDGANPPELLADIEPGYGSSMPSYLIHYKNKAELLFVATSINTIQRELYVYRDSTVSIEKSNSNIAATLYPNPTTQDAYLDVKLKEAQTMQVLVTDIRGRIVYNSKAQLYSTGSHTINLPVQQLPPGAYVYRIADKNGMLLQSGKLLKE